MTLRASTNPSCASESTCGTAAFSFELCHLNLQSNWKHCKVCSMSTWTPKHFELFTIVNNYSLNSIQYVHWIRRIPFTKCHSTQYPSQFEEFLPLQHLSFRVDARWSTEWTASEWPDASLFSLLVTTLVTIVVTKFVLLNLWNSTPSPSANFAIRYYSRSWLSLWMHLPVLHPANANHSKNRRWSNVGALQLDNLIE